MRVMALDVGDRTVGVAISDEGGVLGQGLTVLRRRDPAGDLRRIEALCREHGAGEVVVGLPRSLDGRIGAQARKVLAFVEALRRRLPVPVTTWDERLTTRVAERALLEADVSRRRRREKVDQVAAAVILQGYLDARRHAAAAPGNDRAGQADGGGAPADQKR
jgi:putative Holliday junction resolvase